MPSFDTIAGVMLGTALGDALGLPHEGLHPRRIARRLRRRPFGHAMLGRRGLLSDDTEHTCMVARALAVSGGDVDAFRVSFARALGQPRRGFVGWYHHYVSADPSVNIAGSPLPLPAAPTDVAAFPLTTIVEAACASVRELPTAIRRVGIARDVFVGLAREQGWRSWDILASACDCTSRAIRFIADRIDPRALQPARLCLGDARLRSDRNVVSDHEKAIARSRVAARR